MPEPISAGIGLVTGIGSAAVQSSAARRAGRAQTNAMNEGIARQDQAFETVQKLLNPYVQAGTPALRGMLDIAGIGGPRFDAQSYFAANPDVAQEWTRVQNEGRFGSPDEYAQWHFQNYGQGEGRQANIVDGQQAAIDGLEDSPIFQALARQGEDAILQNASATGGLRGGNTQGALARFRPALLDRFIEQQYGRMADVASIGGNAAGAVGQAAIGTANNATDLLVSRGQAQAGAIGAQGQIFGNTLGQLGGMAAGMMQPRPPITSGTVARLTPSVQGMMANNPGIF